MASLDGGPIVLVLLNLVMLFFLSPLGMRQFSLVDWLLCIVLGGMGSIVGSFGFMVLGGSDHAPRVFLCLPFLGAWAGAHLVLKRANAPDSKEQESEIGVSKSNES